MSAVLGIDLSLNHAAFIVLSYDIGELEDYHVVINTSSIHKLRVADDWSTLLKLDKTNMAWSRLNWWDDFCQHNMTHLIKDHNITHVALENYAFAANRKSHEIGEVGGIVKRQLFNTGVNIRLYAPTQIKQFGTSNGHATKEMMLARSAELGEDWSWLCPAGTKLWESAEDCADAYITAQMLRTELRLKAGLMPDIELTKKERAVFDKAGKSELTIVEQPFVRKNA